jgi:dihydrofolate synthase/folylpolyglutamate synthase
MIFGALDSKSHEEMLEALIPYAGRFVFTTPQVVGKQGLPADELADRVRALGYQGEVMAIPRPLDALETAFARSRLEDAIVVTGSMYLVGNIREHWYPTRDIVLQRTPWPGRRTP